MPHKQSTENLSSTQPGHQIAQAQLQAWRDALELNVYDRDLRHRVHHYFSDRATQLDGDLDHYGEVVASRLEPLVAENDYRLNLPRHEPYTAVGERTETIAHHPNYVEAGDIIYGTGMMAMANEPGRLLESLIWFYLSSHVGEGGHHCPIACSAGILRVFAKTPDFKSKSALVDKLIAKSYRENFTGAQFVTEIQGGSDVGLNATLAHKDREGHWRITGEKWFCSNANADLMLMTARFDDHIKGTKGLGLFLVPRLLDSGEVNHFRIRRLKEKLGTRTMASAEIDFNGAYATPMGELNQGFKLLMSNVLHLSRIYNSFAASALSSRAYQIAHQYARHRIAFGQPILGYPLVQEQLAIIRTETNAMTAFSCVTAQLQDAFDLGHHEDELLLRITANLIKHITATWCVEHVHHAIDILGGNGAIESFSPLPRLLRDSIVLENWEGTHNTLRLQILRDIHRYQIDEVYLAYLDRGLAGLALSPERDQLAVWIQQTRERLLELRKAHPKQQAWLIRFSVDDMAKSGCALSLLQEAQGSQEHLELFRLFAVTHFEGRQSLRTSDYLELIESITN